LHTLQPVIQQYSLHCNTYIPPAETFVTASTENITEASERLRVFNSVVMIPVFTHSVSFGQIFLKTGVTVSVSVLMNGKSAIKRRAGMSNCVGTRVSPDGPRWKKIIESDIDKTKAVWGAFEEI